MSPNALKGTLEDTSKRTTNNGIVVIPSGKTKECLEPSMFGSVV